MVATRSSLLHSLSGMNRIFVHGVRVRERVCRHGGEGAGLVVQGDDVHLVSVLLHERPDRQAESLVLAHLRDDDTVGGAGGIGA